MEDDPSYIDAGAKCSASYVPISMWNQDNDMLMRICCERDSLKDHERELENKIDALHSEVKDLETSLQAQIKTPSYAVVTKPQRAPQAQAKRAPAVSKPLFVLKVSDTSKTGTTRGTTNPEGYEGQGHRLTHNGLCVCVIVRR